MAIKNAVDNADKIFNDDLFDHFCSKDDVSFWRAWRKRYCSSSIKTVSTLNGKHGDGEICAEFTEKFQTVFKTNTVDSDRGYESELQDLLIRNAEYDDASSKVDIGLCQRSLKTRTHQEMR